MYVISFEAVKKEEHPCNVHDISINLGEEVLYSCIQYLKLDVSSDNSNKNWAYYVYSVPYILVCIHIWSWVPFLGYITVQIRLASFFSDISHWQKSSLSLEHSRIVNESDHTQTRIYQHRTTLFCHFFHNWRNSYLNWCRVGWWEEQQQQHGLMPNPSILSVLRTCTVKTW